MTHLQNERVHQVIQHGVFKGIYKVSAKDVSNYYNNNQKDYIADQIIIELANAGFQIVPIKK